MPPVIFSVACARLGTEMGFCVACSRERGWTVFADWDTAVLARACTSVVVHDDAAARVAREMGCDVRVVSVGPAMRLDPETIDFVARVGDPWSIREPPWT